MWTKSTIDESAKAALWFIVVVGSIMTVAHLLGIGGVIGGLITLYLCVVLNKKSPRVFAE